MMKPIVLRNQSAVPISLIVAALEYQASTSHQAQVAIWVSIPERAFERI